MYQMHHMRNGKLHSAPSMHLRMYLRFKMLYKKHGKLLLNNKGFQLTTILNIQINLAYLDKIFSLSEWSKHVKSYSKIAW